MPTNKEYVLVTEYFHPDTASTGQLLTDLAVGLEEHGLNMTVYTGQPNYHSGDNNNQPSTSTYEGVRVKRIRAPQVRQSSLIRRCFNWFVFTIWVSIVLLFSQSQRNREIIFVSNPPFLPVAMWLLCRIRKWDYTYIVYDLYPDMAIEPGYLTRGGVVDSMWSLLNKRIFCSAKNIVALGPAMRENIIEYGGEELNPGKVEIIHNWEDGDFIEPKRKENNWFAKQHGLVKRFVVLYSGNIGENHDLETIIRAAKRFNDAAVTFLIIGEGDKKDEIKELADNLNLRGDTVQFLPYQDLEDLPYTLTAGDVSVVTVSDGMKGVCVSSKLYTSMATGSPILVISEPGDDEAQIVEKYRAGMHATQGNAKEVSDIISKWKSNPDLVNNQGANAREAFESKFTKDQAIDEYYQLLTGS